MIVEVAHVKVDCDPNTTRAAYAKRATGSPEECGCLHCRNFAAARHVIYPEQALELFAKMSIDPNREAEIYHNARLPSGLHFYGGWFHFVGKPASASDYKSNSDFNSAEFVSISEHFQIAVTSNVQLVPPAFDGLPLLQLEFLVETPWVISEPFIE